MTDLNRDVAFNNGTRVGRDINDFGRPLLVEENGLLKSRADSTTFDMIVPVTEVQDAAAIIYVEPDKTLELAISNDALSDAITDFEIWFAYKNLNHDGVRPSANGDLISRVAAAGDYTTPNAPVLAASGSLLAIAAGATAWVTLDVTGVYEVYLFPLVAAGDAAELTIRGVKNVS